MIRETTDAIIKFGQDAVVVVILVVIGFQFALNPEKFSRLTQEARRKRWERIMSGEEPGPL